MAEENESREYYYKVDPDYRIIAANSILTTLTTDGQVKVDFCVESLSIPDKLTFPVGDGKKLSAPLSGDPEPRTQRYVQVGVLVTIDQADIIASLLRQLVDQARTKNG